MALLAGVSAIREVIAFPKTARGQDLMSGAPSPVEAEQLAELGIQVAPRANVDADSVSDQAASA